MSELEMFNVPGEVLRGLREAAAERDDALARIESERTGRLDAEKAYVRVVERERTLEADLASVKRAADAMAQAIEGAMNTDVDDPEFGGAMTAVDNTLAAYRANQSEPPETCVTGAGTQVDLGKGRTEPGKDDDRCPEPCPDCESEDGMKLHEPSGERVPCPSCSGTGRKDDAGEGSDTHPQTECPDCEAMARALEELSSLAWELLPLAVRMAYTNCAANSKDLPLLSQQTKEEA